jgi:hypothetical protein
MRLDNFQTDGIMNVINNQKKETTYFENAKGLGPQPDPSAKICPFAL